MLSKDIKDRQNKLNGVLKELSVQVIDDETAKTYIESLRAIYRDGFRHQYSAFFPLLLNIAESSDSAAGNLEFLSNSLNVINKVLEESYVTGGKSHQGLYYPLSKLCDHVNLEIARIQNSVAQEMKMQDLERELAETQKELTNAKRELSDAQNALSLAKSELTRAEAKLSTSIDSANRASTAADKASTKADQALSQAGTLKNEIITVLSIFSAVVLAFMGGMSFSSSTLESMHASSIYKVAFIAIICGLVVFNTICGLMYLVAKITGKNIFVTCPVGDCTCTCESGCIDPCPAHKRLRRRLPYVFWFNVAMFFLLGAIVLAWIFDLHSFAEWIRSKIPLY